MNLYVFMSNFNFWNNWDWLLMLYGNLHLIVPVYAILLSFFEVPTIQVVIYYFGSAISTIGNIILGIDIVMSLLGLF